MVGVVGFARVFPDTTCLDSTYPPMHACAEQNAL
jgi:hypothetical protein